MQENELAPLLYQEIFLGMKRLGFFPDGTDDVKPLGLIDPELISKKTPYGSEAVPTFARHISDAATDAETIGLTRRDHPDLTAATLYLKLENNVRQSDEMARKVMEHPEMAEPAKTALAHVKALASLAVAREPLTFDGQLTKFMDDPFQGYQSGPAI